MLNKLNKSDKSYDFTILFIYYKDIRQSDDALREIPGFVINK